MESAGTNYGLTCSVCIDIPVSGHVDGLAKQTGGKTKATQDHIRASGGGRCGRGNVMQEGEKGGGGGWRDHSETPVMWGAEDELELSAAEWPAALLEAVCTPARRV